MNKPWVIADDNTFLCRKTFKRKDGTFSDPPKDLATAATGKVSSLTLPHFILGCLSMLIAYL